MTYVKEAEKLAHGLIQGYLGPDHKVRDMQSFFVPWRRHSWLRTKRGLDRLCRRGKFHDALSEADMLPPTTRRVSSQLSTHSAPSLEGLFVVCYCKRCLAQSSIYSPPM
jgi:hypothetical protein